MACYIIIHLWICIHNKQVTNNKIYTNCQSCLLPRGSIIISHQQGYKTALTMCTVFEQNKILITARHPYPFSTSFHAFTVLCNNIKQLIVFTKMYIKLYEISSTLPWKPGRCHNMLNLPFFPNEPPHDKTNNVAVRPPKTHISLGIHPVWSASSLPAWRKLGSLATHWAHSEDSDQTLLVLSCCGSNPVFSDWCMQNQLSDRVHAFNTASCVNMEYIK